MSSQNTSGDTMRLDKFIAHSAGLSRSDVKRLLRNQLVTVNDNVVRDPAQIVTPQCTVKLDGETLPWPRHHYVMLYKPEGYVCSTDDVSNPIVHGLIDETWADALHCAGRLDADTTGLVLLTDDGEWSHAVTSPRKQCIKTYLVSVRHVLNQEIVAQFAQGLMLNGETKLTLPAQIDIIDEKAARVRISEGRYHQVKRMFAATGNRVEALHRESVGGISLDADMQPGDWRELTDTEVRSIHDA